MRHFILMRHAQAASPQVGQDDSQRSLTPQGRRDAQDMATRLAARGRTPDLVLASDSRRTLETWEAMSQSLGAPKVKAEARLYNADAETLRHRLEDVEGRCDILLMIAHNPGVQFLAAILLEEAGAPQTARDAVNTGFATGQALLFQVDPAGRCLYEGVIRPGDAA